MAWKRYSIVCFEAQGSLLWNSRFPWLPLSAKLLPRESMQFMHRTAWFSLVLFSYLGIRTKIRFEQPETEWNEAHVQLVLYHSNTHTHTHTHEHTLHPIVRFVDPFGQEDAEVIVWAPHSQQINRTNKTVMISIRRSPPLYTDAEEGKVSTI